MDRYYPMAKPGLTLHRLELFLAVLDEGGVGRAAKACHISQPAVSEHLQGLGAHFGVPLLERHGRSVRPTPAARLLEPYARQAVGLLRGAERADRKSTRLNSSHANISYAVFCLKKKTSPRSTRAVSQAHDGSADQVVA